MRILWTFEPVTHGTRTFVVEYDVLGALRNYLDEDPAHQQIWWTAIGKELSKETPVQTSTETVMLPLTCRRRRSLSAKTEGTNQKRTQRTAECSARTRDDFGCGDDFTVRLQ